MPEKKLVRELLLYSEKIKVEDVLNLFNQVLKARLPLFGFLDFSDLFSINVLQLVIRRKLNTVQFYIHEKKSLSTLSMLVFPYKISDLMELEKKQGSFLPFPKIYFLVGDRDFLSFMLKESAEELNLRIIKIFGKFLGFGNAIDEKGKKSLIVSLNPEQLLVVDLEKNPSVYIDVLEPIPKRMSLTSKYPVFEETGITVGVDNFDVFQHSLFVGASGTGKSKCLYAMIKAIEAKYGDGVRILLIDPHGEFVRSMHDAKIVNFVDNYIEPLDVGGLKTPLMTQLIAQLLSSAIGQENKYSERVLFYVTHLLSSIDKMDLKNISVLLTDSSKRAEFLSETENDEVKRFFDEEFNDIYIHHFNDAVLPILNFVGEYELYLGGEKKRENLIDLLKNNRITVVSFNPNFFGKRMINFMAGAIINQMYILAITERLNLPTILVMDEFQRVETKVVKDILAETRKFNLYVYLSMQYLGQVSKEIHDSIISNIRNIVSFKANRQDATMLSSIMEIKIEESFKKSRTQTELEESKKEMFVRLHQKECIARLFDGKKYILPMKLRVVDVYSQWGYKEFPLEQVMPTPKVPPSMAKKAAPQEKAQVEKTEEEQMVQENPLVSDIKFEAFKVQSEDKQTESSEEEVSSKRPSQSLVKSQIEALKQAKLRKDKENKEPETNQDSFEVEPFKSDEEPFAEPYESEKEPLEIEEPVLNEKFEDTQENEGGEVLLPPSKKKKKAKKSKSSALKKKRIK